MVKIATWNVNSIKARLPNVLDWIKSAKPDILLLQEIKCVDDAFPRLEFEEQGYNVAVKGQKTYNGVAVLSLTPLETIETEMPGDKTDEHARYLECVTKTDAGTLRVASIYLPNGNPIGTDKFAFKLRWMERLYAHARMLLTYEEPTILGGDYNVIPLDEDCYDPRAWIGDALFQPESKAAFRRFCHLGYTDAFRVFHRESGAYTFWDYQAGAWPKDHGIRIDHLMLSPQAADLLTDCAIDRRPRGKERASDHTPIWCELKK